MPLANVWESPAAVLAVLTPLVAVPLTAIGFYLRALRENQDQRIEELLHRIEQTEAGLRDARRDSADLARDFTSKEEWLRESMHTRHRVEQLSSALARLQGERRQSPDSPRDTVLRPPDP